MKRKLALFSVIVLVFGILAACNNSSSESSTNTNSNGETIDLTWYYPVNVGGAVTEVIDKYAEDFNNEGIEVNGKKVTVTPVYSGNYDETMTKVQTAIKNGKAPDLSVQLSVDLFQIKNSIVPLDDFIKNDPAGQEMVNDFFPGFMENAQTEGKDLVNSIPKKYSHFILQQRHV